MFRMICPTSASLTRFLSVVLCYGLILSQLILSLPGPAVAFDRQSGSQRAISTHRVTRSRASANNPARRSEVGQPDSFLRNGSSSSNSVASQPLQAQQSSSTIVISQIYGGGGNSGATYKNDFIELFNRSDSTVDLTNWTVQYAPAGSGTWQVTPLSGSLAAGKYLLIQGAQGAGGTTDLPTPDVVSAISINATAGKVALTNHTTALSNTCPLGDPSILDLVGYGSSASCFEGSSPTNAPSNTKAVLRANDGHTDTNNNATDFLTAIATPRNSGAAESGGGGGGDHPASTTIVISEFRTSGNAGGFDEFIELYNRTGNPIDISGWKIKASNGEGVIGTRVTIHQGTIIPSRGHFLATNNNDSSGYSSDIAGDQTYTTGIPEDGGIALFKPDDTVVDSVGMSEGSAFKEGRALPTLIGGVEHGYERKPGWGNGSDQDTNDNPSDFDYRQGSDPQNLHSPPSSTSNQPPVAQPNGPYYAQTGVYRQFNGWGSMDPDGYITYRWDFGDGSTAPYKFSDHRYSAAGTYTVTLTVTDNVGAQASASTTCTVTDDPPPTPTPTPTPTATPTPTPIPTDLKVVPKARLEPRNRVGTSGEDLLSGNFNWSLPLMGLKGRAGLDLGLALAYNSLTWTRDLDGQRIVFDEDQGYPSPGFRLGFPVIQGYYDENIIWEGTPPQHSYTIIMPSGERVGMWQVGSSNVYESSDSSYLRLVRVAGTSKLYLTNTNGTQYKFVLYGDSYRCVEIKDRNGNYISAGYDPQGRLLTITDTLARVFTFNYAGGNLVSITQPWGGQPHVWARFEYEPLVIQSNFVKSDGTPLQAVGNGQTINALKRVVLADQSSYRFTYNTWGQVYKIARHATDDHLLTYSSYDLPINNGASLTDCPRFTQRHDWAQYWNGDQDGVPAAGEEAINRYTIALDGEMGSVTLPDNTTTNKEYFGTATWQKGLTTKVETYDGGALRRWMTTLWTQDDERLDYRMNPRQMETNTYDPEGNRRRARTIYTERTASQRFSLPSETLEYDSDATTVRKHTYTSYNLSSDYVTRNIIGLVSEQKVYVWVNEPIMILGYVIVPGQNKLASKVSYEYDIGGSYLVAQDEPVQHDGNYGAGFVQGRANLGLVRRWDTKNSADWNKSLTSQTGYNTSGSVIFMRDPVGSAERQTVVSYTDSNGGQTRAYPTAVTDPDGYTTTMQYNYDIGQVVGTRNPKGAEQVMTYDPVTGDLQRQTQRDGVNNQDVTYTRFVYAPSQTEVATYTLMDAGVESYSVKRVDGAGNVIGTASNHPGSAGGYSGQKFTYDVMGRQTGRTTPTEISNPAGAPVADWTPTGEDAGNWRWSYQQYDWKGRPTVSTNIDGTVTEAIYTGCGCAGGEIVTLKGEQLAEGRRTSKTYRDFLGRETKTEVFDWNGNIYNTTVNTYDHRDQVTLVRQYAGAEGSATFQDTTYSYDGYGRLYQRHAPEQSYGTFTTYTYNADDSVESMTDARSAKTSYEYNKRGLLSKISYSAPNDGTWDSIIQIPGPTTFSYDEAGNRVVMTDESGSLTYEYDTLSRLKAETRQFNETVPQAPSGNQFKLQYTYTLSGQLKSITDPYGEYIGYSHDGAGRLAGVSGILPDGEALQYASSAEYRAWGALKRLVYGTGMEMRLSFNNRLQAEEYSLVGRRHFFTYGGQKDDVTIRYQYYADGRLRFSDESHTQASHYPSALFARSYEYDFMGRLTLAKTGAEARGQVETDLNKRPYRQTYSYDSFGHMTRADRWHWTENYVTSQVYQNNLSSEGSYDADGRPSGKYDAGGRLVYHSESDSSIGGTTQWRDGTGQVLKSRAVGDACERDIRCELTTYFIRSTVLGGEAVNEISQTYYLPIIVGGGFDVPAWTVQKRATYIIAGGMRMGKHEIVSNELYPHNNHDTTSIENRDASGVFFDEMVLRGTGAAYSFGSSAATRPNYYLESDPFGATVGLESPYIPPPDDDYRPPPCPGPEPDDCGDPEEDEEESDYSYLDYEEEGYGNPVEFTCYVDGFPSSCQDVFEFIDKAGEGSGNVTRDREFAAPSTTGPQAIWKDEYSTVSMGDVVNEIDPNGSPNQVVAQVNVGIEDEGYFVMGNAVWDMRGGTGDRAHGESKQQKSTPCEKFLAGQFTRDPKAIFVDVNDGDGFDPITGDNRTFYPYGTKPPVQGTIGETHNHIYNDPAGNVAKPTEIYAPSGGEILDSGLTSGGDTFITVFYSRFGTEKDVVLQIIHVENFNKKLLGAATGRKGVLLGRMGPNGSFHYEAVAGNPLGYHVHINAMKKWWKGKYQRGKTAKFLSDADRKHIKLSALCPK